MVTRRHCEIIGLTASQRFLRAFPFLVEFNSDRLRHLNFQHPAFLAHLSTKCSVSFCDPSMSGVRCPSSVRPSVRPSTISLNNISSETAYWILTKLHRNDPWWSPIKVVQTVPVGCISRSRGQKIVFQNAIFKNLLVCNY